MRRFCQDFGTYISKIVNRFSLQENEQVVFQGFACDEEVDGDMLCLNVDLRVDCQESCTGIISVHNDLNMQAKVGEAFQKPADMAPTVGHSNEFSFGSCFGDGALFL